MKIWLATPGLFDNSITNLVKNWRMVISWGPVTLAAAWLTASLNAFQSAADILDADACCCCNWGCISGCRRTAKEVMSAGERLQPSSADLKVEQQQVIYCRFVLLCTFFALLLNPCEVRLDQWGRVWSVQHQTEHVPENPIFSKSQQQP